MSLSTLDLSLVLSSLSSLLDQKGAQDFPSPVLAPRRVSYMVIALFTTFGKCPHSWPGCPFSLLNSSHRENSFPYIQPEPLILAYSHCFPSSHRSSSQTVWLCLLKNLLTVSKGRKVRAASSPGQRSTALIAAHYRPSASASSAALLWTHFSVTES